MELWKLTTIGLCILILGSGIFDLGTFLKEPRFQIFEANPIDNYLKLPWLSIVLKVVVNLAYCFVLIVPPKSRFIRFAIVMGSVFLIILQTLGGLSNMEVHQAQPSPDRVMPVAEATKTYFNIVYILYIYPMLVSLLGFKLFDLTNLDLEPEDRRWF